VPPTPPLALDRAIQNQRDESGQAAPAIDSVALMSGRRELIIRHGTATYRLRITASNKLILTK
jgi:hemin uptake protein HemP